VTPFESLVYEPENNVNVEPQEPSTFMAIYRGFFFSATGKQGQVPSTLGDVGKEGEGLAKAGGLLDDEAEPSWVLLYCERRSVVEELDPKCVVQDHVTRLICAILLHCSSLRSSRCATRT
jgi:hypothetical protein